MAVAESLAIASHPELDPVAKTSLLYQIAQIFEHDLITYMQGFSR